MPCLNGRHFSTNILQIESICKSGTKRQLRMSTPSASAHHHILGTKFMSQYHSTPRHISQRQGRNVNIGLVKQKKTARWEVMNTSPFKLSCDGSFLRMCNCIVFSKARSTSRNYFSCKRLPKRLTHGLKYSKKISTVTPILCVLGTGNLIFIFLHDKLAQNLLEGINCCHLERI